MGGLITRCLKVSTFLMHPLLTGLKTCVILFQTFFLNVEIYFVWCNQ